MTENRSAFDGTGIPSDLPGEFREVLAADDDASLFAVDEDGSDDRETGEDAGRDDAGTTQNVEEYANRAGRVNHEKLREAMADWKSGTITRGVLDEVIEAWRTGERVVEKEVIEITFEDDFEEDTTLERNPEDPTRDEAVVYRVTDSIEVKATLTIEPGVVMEFEEGERLFVRPDNGGIVAEGAPNDPILMTATTPRRGWWSGVEIDDSDHPRNTLSHVIVEYGQRGVELDKGATRLNNCELRQNSEYGLFIGLRAELLDHEGRGSGSNTYLNNGAPVFVDGGAHMLSKDSTYTSNTPARRNDTDAVVGDLDFRGRDADQTEYTMKNLGVPYRISDLDIRNATLSIEPGTRVESEEGAMLDVHEDARALMQGTAENPIVFTGTEQERGWWDGIDFDAEDREGILEHCIVEYGGDEFGAALTLTGEAEVEIRNCTFRHSAGYGVYLNAGTTIKDAENNVYTGNAKGPAWANTPQANHFSATSDFTGNDNDYVYVDAWEANSSRVTGEFTWEGINVPYRMQGEEHEINSVEWTIEPGATLEFEEGGWLDLDPSCSISFEGEPGNEITLTGTQEQRGWWGALFVETDTVTNTLRHAVVEYGGNGFGGGVRMDGGSTLHVEHCTFRHNDGYGLYTGNVTLEPLGKEMQENVYTENAEGAVRTRTPSANQLSATSEFTGNDDDHVYVKDDVDIRPHRVTGEFTWDAIDVPYRLSGHEHRFFDIEWTIEPGATLEIEENGEFNLQGGCKLSFEGASGNEITFTGTADEQGWWGKLAVKSYSQTNTMTHTVVENAGGGGDGAVRLDDGRFEPMENCTIRTSGSEGLYVQSNATDQINDSVCEVNTFEDNAGPDCYFEDGG